MSELPTELPPILDVAPEHQPTLQQGSEGIEVEFVINHFGFETEVDGLFGAQTDEQVRQFQSEHGLAVDGIVGVETWTVMFNEHEVVIFPVEQAITYAEEALDNDDLVFSSDGVLHKDSDGNVFYSLKAQSQDLIDDGGSGTVGFYDVYQNGVVVESEPR
ncbi:peptidoglycan-binding domain-containing protein [Sporosarcina globispora]|nr:peptidoglycan-binding domain-containing protein [Sporosarcina globispora]